MAHQEPIRKRPGGPVREIPDKLYFRIGEVAKLCEVPAYVLRFWEGEFPQLKPNKGGTGQRLYRRRDVEMALRIKTLLYDEGYTIPGARQAFKAELRSGKDPQLGLAGQTAAPAEPGAGTAVDIRHLQAIQKELRELHALLSRPAVSRTPVLPMRRHRHAPEAPATPQPTEAPAPVAFPRPKLLQPAPRSRQSDAFVNSLFDDLPPLA